MIFKLLFSVATMLFFFGCDEKSDPKSDDGGLINTLSQSSIGLSQDLISDYFYNFESSINVTFLNYRQDGPINTILYPELINESPYDAGWILKIKINDSSEMNALMSSSDYNNLIK